MMDNLKGHTISIVNAQDHTFELNEKDLKSILLHEEVRDKKVVVISVAGAFRKGKSFLLNFMLRYLEAEGNALWLGDDNQPLKGFSWRGGSERDTTGILMWSKIFLVPVPSGEKVAVLLMDTQGAFDSSSTVKECATVFALSTMISSIQVYNLSQNIQEDDLQHLELFAEYGRLALEDINETPFQKLVFLVRDWSFPYDAEYGDVGGQKILDRRLMISDKQHPQLQQLRMHIKACFSEVSCFLMPHPGLDVATSCTFDGRLADIRDDFKQQLKLFISNLLSPENLVPKKIGGKCITARELITYFKTYIEIFKGDELPEPKSMLQATAEANNLAAMADAKEFYNSSMEKVCGGDCPYLNPDVLDKKHLLLQQTAVQKFLTTRKMGSEDLSHMYLARLQKELEEMFNSFVRFNDSKKISNALRTPTTLLFVIVFCYLNSYLVSAMGLSSVSVLSSILMGICIIALTVWSYARFTGEWQHLSCHIDNAVSFFLMNLIFPGQKALVEMIPNKLQMPSAATVEPLLPSSSGPNTPQPQGNFSYRRT